MSAQEQQPPGGAAASAVHPAAIRDILVQTQDGRTARFYSELVKGRLVVVNFIFTSCTTVCPLMGVRFAHLQSLLGERTRDVSLISVSIDPTTDTPERLAAWSRRMGAKPGWTLVTGAKPDIESLTQSLGASAADPASHAPLVLIIDDRDGRGAGRWQRLDGLADPSMLARILGELVASGPPAPVVGVQPPHASGAEKYFSGVTLVDQDGASVDLYALMKDRTSVMNSFFATCTGSCPVMARTLQAVQARYPEHLGKELVLVSITVDPAKDTPAKLKEYARRLKAGPGWYFLTGSKEQVATALKRIGQQADAPEQHANMMIIGNEKTGLWKKAFGLAKTEDILELVGSVLNDDGTAPVK